MGLQQASVAGEVRGAQRSAVNLGLDELQVKKNCGST